MLVRVELTKARLDWLNDQHVMFSNVDRPRLSVGDFLTFHNGVELEPYVGFNSGFSVCSMGFLSYSNSPVPPDLTVGRYCSLAGNIRIGGFRHPVEYLSTSIFTYDRRNALVAKAVSDDKSSYDSFKIAPQKKPITIGHDVWVGRDVSVMPNVSIGTGSVIASAAVVTKDVAPYSIMGGNPAKLIRMRFPQEIVERLIESEWWRYKFTDFNGMNVADPEIFLQQLQSRTVIREYEPNKIRMSEISDIF